MARGPKLACSEVIRVTFRAADPELQQLRETLFCRYPRKESGTFFRCGWRATRKGLLLTLATLDLPQSGDLDESSPIVVLREPYSLRMALTAEKHALAVGIAHSHPRDYFPNPSPTDDDMDAYYATYFAGFAPGRPYVSLIFAERGDDLTASRRVYWQNQWFAVRDFVLARFSCLTWVNSKAPVSAMTPLPRLARLSGAFGQQAETRLRNATVAVVGAGGTGSVAIEVLARAGVGSIVLIDPDRMEESNLERVHGSTPAHVASGALKAAIARDHIKLIAPNCNVVAIAGALPQSEVIDELLHANVLVCCTDTEHSRLAIADLAIRYLIPAIDVGVALEGKNGRVSGQITQLTRFLAADPCPLCRRMIVQSRLNQELMSEEQRQIRQQEARAAVERGERPDPYWQSHPQLNTVGYHTTAAGALAAGYAIGWLTNRFDPPFHRVQMNFVASGFEVVDLSNDAFPRRSECSCGIVRGYADQGERHALITPPSHWARPQVL